jgi:hypothetical protein
MERARAPGGGGGPASNLAAHVSLDVARRADPPDREIQELWFALARRQWRSLALVPADEGGSAAAVATSLAEVGRRLRDAPVTFFVMADPLDYVSTSRILTAFESTQQGGSALAMASGGRVIVAVQPVIVEPLGLAVAQSADAVVLCLELGRTRLAAARRTVELVGRERIAGCLLTG